MNAGNDQEKQIEIENRKEVFKHLKTFTEEFIDKLLFYNKIIASIGYFALFTALPLVKEVPSSCLFRLEIVLAMTSVFLFIIIIWLDIYSIQKTVRSMRRNQITFNPENGTPIKEEIDKYLEPLKNTNSSIQNIQYWLFLICSFTGLLSGVLLIGICIYSLW